MNGVIRTCAAVLALWGAGVVSDTASAQPLEGGNYLELDGVDDSVRAGGDFVYAEMTVEAWVRPSSLHPSFTAGIVTYGSRSVSSFDFGIGQVTDPRLRLLAGRLLERRPSAVVVRRGVASGEIPSTLTDLDDPEARLGPPPMSWPEPDPSRVTLEGGPWKSGLVAPLARQVEVGRPRWLARGDVPAAVLDAVGAAALEQALADGLPEGVAGRVAAGAVDQFVHETVLLEQCSVVDPGRLVKDLLVGTEVHVVDFAGREVGRATV